MLFLARFGSFQSFLLDRFLETLFRTLIHAEIIPYHYPQLTQISLTDSFGSLIYWTEKSN